MNAHKAAKPMTWVKDKKGNTYICPTEDLIDTSKLDDGDLKNYCLDESNKPWND